MSKLKLYLKLFTSTFYISTFTFGGGFVIIPLLKKKFVDNLKWIEEKEMLDITAIAQSSPGAVAVNTSVLIGYKIAGFIGALITILGTILPPLIIITVISYFYHSFKDIAVIGALFKGMQAGIAAVIADVVITMAGKIFKEKNIVSVIIMAAAFVAVYFLEINVFFIILGSGLIGFIVFKINNKKKAVKNDIS